MRSVWKVVALETPSVRRVCPRCDGIRPFVSTDRFRVNAQGRLLDVWLIYRCPTCDFAWNREVLARRTPEQIGPARLAAFHENDREAAWRCAFDRGRDHLDPRVPYRVEREGDGAVIELHLPWPCAVRLDRLLAGELRLSRAQVARAIDAPASLLRRDISDGQVVALR